MLFVLAHCQSLLGHLKRTESLKILFFKYALLTATGNTLCCNKEPLGDIGKSIKQLMIYFIRQKFSHLYTHIFPHTSWIYFGKGHITVDLQLNVAAIDTSTLFWLFYYWSFWSITGSPCVFCSYFHHHMSTKTECKSGLGIPAELFYLRAVLQTNVLSVNTNSFLTAECS